jgi:hypothetical protein
MNRRVFLRAGLLAPIGLGLADAIRLRSVAQASPPRTGSAKACILLYMTGGPAQHETFDPRPNAREGIRGEFRPIATSVPGIQICEHLPLLAQQAQRYAILRSVFHDSATHGVGVHSIGHRRRKPYPVESEPEVRGEGRAAHGAQRHGSPDATTLTMARSGKARRSCVRVWKVRILGPQDSPLG